jgi:transposase
MTMPGVGFILSVVMVAEIGDVGRFEGPDHFASCAGTTPRLHASGGKTRYGPLRPDVNRYVKWAFVEAANASCRIRRRHPQRHVSRFYERLARPKEAPRSHGRGRTACGRSDVLEVEQRRAIPGASQHAKTGLVDGGVSAS